METEGGSGSGQDSDRDHAYRVVEAEAEAYDGRKLRVVTLTISPRIKARLQVSWKAGCAFQSFQCWRIWVLLCYRLAVVAAGCIKGSPHMQPAAAAATAQLHSPPPLPLPHHPLLCCKQGRDALPSLRYLTLIREGAEEYGLSPEYRAWLQELQPYRAEAFGQRVGAWVFSSVAGLTILPVWAGGWGHARGCCVGCAMHTGARCQLPAHACTHASTQPTTHLAHHTPTRRPGLPPPFDRHAQG